MTDHDLPPVETSTVDARVRATLGRLVADHRAALADRVLGMYVFGSAVSGWFEPGSSDVDVLVALREDPTVDDIGLLRSVLEAFVTSAPEWNDRLECVYVSVDALARFRERPSPAARISPGEPFHPITVDPSWLIDWYRVLEDGVALFGPPVSEVVPPITPDEYVEAVRAHLRSWRGWTTQTLEHHGEQAYVILTMCRGLRTATTGDHVSKRDGARWAMGVMPPWTPLIRDALVWHDGKRDALVDAPAPRPADVRAFVRDVLERMDDASRR